MKLVGKKRLLANNYNQIIITEKDKEIVCKVKAKKDIKGNIVDSLSNELKDKNDGEQVLIIVNEFLRNNKIVNISDGAFLSHYDNHFIEIITSNNKKLDIESSLKVDCINEILSNILLKYNIDRYNKIYNNINNINKIFIFSEDHSSGYTIVKENDLENDNIAIKCARVDNKINMGDTKFITDFMNTLLSHYEGIVTTSEILRHIKVTIGNKGLWIPVSDKAILDIIMEIRNNHNKEINDCKKRQLKLEGYNNEYGKNGKSM